LSAVFTAVSGVELTLNGLGSFRKRQRAHFVAGLRATPRRTAHLTQRPALIATRPELGSRFERLPGVIRVARFCTRKNDRISH
jgi:hypothetical protein